MNLLLLSNKKLINYVFHQLKLITFFSIFWQTLGAVVQVFIKKARTFFEEVNLKELFTEKFSVSVLAKLFIKNFLINC